METPDENTIVFILGQSYAPFLSNLAVGWAAIVPKEAVERGNFRSNPVGTGPFKFAEWVPDSHVRLVKFTDYFRKGMPYLDEVTFKVIPEDTVRLVNLQTGQVDVVDSILPQKASQVDKMPGLMIVSAPSNAIQIMAVNNARPPFNDIRVRRAINYAIDKKGVIEGAQWGYGTPIGSHMSPVSEYYIDLAERYPYDPAKAKELLTEAGYPNGFKTTIALPQPYDFHIRNGEVIADQLKKVGIEAKLEIVEWASWLSNIYFGNHDYYLTTIGHTGRLDPDPFLNRYATGSRENYMSYRNPRYDELIKEGVSTADPKRRKEIYAEVQRILADDAVAVYLLAPMSLVAMRENVQGWNIYPIDIYDLRTVYKTR
jgi:peptide/nickel transport system substrate-binding protein